MPLSIGVNLRVTGHCNQGGRKYMEDMFSVAYHLTPDDKDLEYAFFGIFDGHGGGEAATFAKEYLMDIIVKQKNFWSDRDEDVLRAIRDGFVNTHYAMWRELDKWPRTASGLPSTAGTTASIAFIRKGKVYIGHVGDSGIILGHQVDGDPQWKAKPLTKDHKPESGPEMIRIQESGGKVVSKSGVPRVVWNRPRIGHKGPVRRSTHIDEIPFLAVARSLGDLWSYNSELDTFVVSPEPDVKVVAIDVKSHRCLIFGTDGLWNMLTPQAAVGIVQTADRHNEKHLIASQQTGNGQTDGQMWINPSKSLVDRALERWSSTRIRADNTSVVTVMLDPPGPSRNEILLSQKKDRVLSPKGTIHHGISTNIRNTVDTCESPPAERVTANITMTNPLIPKPPEYKNLDINEHKPRPDSSNEVEETTNNVKSLNIDLKENNESTEKLAVNKFDTDSRTNDISFEKDDLNSSTQESIQVGEISSSEILEDTCEGDDQKFEESKNKISEDTTKLQNTQKDETSTENKSIEDNDKNRKNTDMRIFVRHTTKLKSDFQVEQSSGLSANSKTNMISSRESFEIRNTCHVSENKYAEMAEMEESKRIVQISDRLKRAGNISNNSVRTNDTFNCSELRNAALNGSRHKRHSSFVNSREEIELRRKHSLNGQQHALMDIGASNSNYPSINSRLKSRNTKLSLTNTEETVRSTVSTTNSVGVGTKRRHSTIHQSILAIGVDEPRTKRRTRSEDRPNPTDENDPANQTTEPPNGRLSWPRNESSVQRSNANGGPTTTSTTSSAISVQERLSSPVPSAFQRKSLGKKATPVKTIRRSSINGTSRLQQLRGSFGLRDWDQARNDRSNSCNERRINRTVSAIIGSTDGTSLPQRWLRSDTMAATPVKTLRSRNVDIAGHTISAQLVHQYGVVKPNRLSIPSKMKQSSSSGSLQSNRHRSSSLSSGKLKQAVSNDTTTSTGNCSAIGTASTGSNSASGIAKRVKTPYNPSARSLSTRSRIKRLGK